MENTFVFEESTVVLDEEMIVFAFLYENIFRNWFCYDAFNWSFILHKHF